MTKSEGMTKSPGRKQGWYEGRALLLPLGFGFWASDFFRHSSFVIPHSFRGRPYSPPSNSSPAAVIAVTPVLRVASGAGAQSGEWRDGSALPVRWLSFRTSGSTPPTRNMQMGIFCCVSPYSEKSSPPMDGGDFTTFDGP